MSTRREGPEKRGVTSPEARRVLEEKLRILRLLRALDRAGVDPAEEPAVRLPLVRLSELDAFLTALLEFAGRADAADREELAAQIESILPGAEAVRGDVRDAVPERYRRALRRADSEVVATEHEILLELEAFRRRPGGTARDPRPMSEAEAEAIAKETWGPAATQDRLRLDPRVDAHEAKGLPDPEAPLRAWFDRTPRPWRKAMKEIHEVRGKSNDPVALRLARRVSDPAWMRHFLAERLGTGEREMIARLLAARAVPVGPGADLHEAFFVAWNWGEHFPAGAGAKLRAAGLVHVGTEGGTRLATVPPPLATLLSDLLEDVDPASASLPERATRHAEAARLENAPFEDETLDRWKRVDLAFSERLAAWVLQSRDELARAVDVLFEDRDRAVHSEPEATALFEYGILDWREDPAAPTIAERRVEETSFASPEERAIARAVVRARPALYRVAGIRRGVGVLLAPIFPAGEAVDVTDRALSLTTEEGLLVALRVYEAGPFCFAREFGPPLEPDRENRIVRALRRELESHVGAGGDADPDAFFRARPAAFLRTLQRYWH